MQSAVESILQGNFTENKRSLSFENPVITFSVGAGLKKEGSFFIDGEPGKLLMGEVSSNRPQMTLPLKEFSGSHVDIPYVFDSLGLKSGDCFKGEFRIISNQGEYLLPYEVKVETESLSTSLGDICNLFHFTNLARTNWDEAVKLFVSNDFDRVLSGADNIYTLDHTLLKDGKDSSQCLEEFLLRVRKKQPIEFIVDDTDIKIDNLSDRAERNIVVNRNGWGYSHLEISTDSRFVILEKEVLEESDFVGNVARIPYSIDEFALHKGKNYAGIRIKNAYTEIEISVCVSLNPANRKVAERERINKHLILDLMHFYEAFRLHKISATTWTEQTGEVVEKLLVNDPDNLSFMMFNIQFLITTERYNEARWQLEHIERDVELSETAELHAYYYYLLTLLDRTKEVTEQATAFVERIFYKDRSKWRIAWLLMYLSDEYTTSPENKWKMLNELCSAGCSSPAIYAEAFQIVSTNPTMLTRLQDFEINTLKYMAKKEVLTPDVVDQFTFLFLRNKFYDRDLLWLLEACYKVNPTEDLLKAICQLLINSNSTDERAFFWYERAIEKSLRITRLYEFYLNSIDMDNVEEIPKIVLMYFSFDSDLDAFHNAFLYSYVYRNKLLIPEIFENYKLAIERFVMFELLAGRNNKYLSYLYKNMLSEGMIMEDMAPGLSKALFANEIIPARKDIRACVVRYENVNTAFTYRYDLNTGSYFAPIYGQGGRVMFEDTDGNRFVREEEYSITRLMVPDKLARVIEKYEHNNEMFDYWQCSLGREIKKVTEHNLESMKRLISYDFISEDFKKMALYRILSYLSETEKYSELDEMLSKVLPEDILSEDFINVLKMLIVRGMHEKALSWIKICAGEGIDPKTLVRILSKMLSEQSQIGEMEYDCEILALVYRAFQGGKYESITVRYLEKYFEGTSKEMTAVWEVAKDYGIDTSGIEKRILEQLLFTGAYIAENRVFFSYSEKQLDYRLCLAYLSQVLYRYFVLSEVTDRAFFDEIKIYFDNEIDIPMILMLAFTKYYSEHLKEANEDIMRIIVVFLKSILAEGMYFPYFRQYAGIITNMHRFADRTMIEHRVKDGESATIHYVIEKKGIEKEEYSSIPMKNMYHGICVQDFVLFFGETLKYYIVENDGERESLTVSGTLSSNEMDEKTVGNKYGLINDISISRTLGDLGTMDTLLNEYFKNEYVLDNLFTMMD